MKKRNLIIITVLISVFLTISARLAMAEVITGKPLYYSVELKDIFTNNNNQPVTNIEITKAFKSDEDNSHPYAVLLKRNLSVKPTSIKVDTKGNQIATFKIARLNPGESITIGEKLYFKGATANYKISSRTVGTDYSNVNFASLYLAPSYLIESDNQLIAETAKNITGNETNPLLKAKKIYGFVNGNITYDQGEAYSNKGALSALTTRRGVCYEYSSLMVALLRSSGIPARMIEGYKIDNKDLKNTPKLADGRIDLTSFGHGWVEFYLPNIGWVASEPTIYLTVNGRKQISWDYFTNLDSQLYIPLQTDNNMDYKIISNGQLNVEKVSALEFNPADLTAPPTDPLIIPPSPELEKDQVILSKSLVEQLNPNSILSWLQSKLLPALMSTFLLHKSFFILFIAILIFFLIILRQ